MTRIVATEFSQCSQDDSAAATEVVEGAALAANSPVVQVLPRARRLPYGPVPAARDRATDSRPEIQVRRTAGYRKIRRVRESADPSPQFQTRYWCGPWFQGARALRRSSARGKPGYNAIFV